MAIMKRLFYMSLVGTDSLWFTLRFAYYGTLVTQTGWEGFGRSLDLLLGLYG